jgi:hypothetical protein
VLQSDWIDARHTWSTHSVVRGTYGVAICQHVCVPAISGYSRAIADAVGYVAANVNVISNWMTSQSLDEVDRRFGGVTAVRI